MTRLQITTPHERWLVRLADLATTPLAWMRSGAPAASPRRILLMRLERIGDLLMTLEAIADARRLFPGATIDLAVGSWNLDLARLIPAVASVHVADVPWLSRGERPTSWRALARASRAWRSAGYDLVVNFEPDIRTNYLAWRTNAPVRVGYDSAGGGAFLTTRAAYDPSVHVATNARRLIHTAAGATTPATSSPLPRLDANEATSRIVEGMTGARRPWIGLHASGGRESKQWHLDRFAETGRRLAEATGGTIVLTGGPADQPLVAEVAKALAGVPLVDSSGTAPLTETVALIAALDLLITGDTGPMHVAGAVNTPVVALFGPSDPRRYGPRAASERIVRVDLPCSPCGQVRLPPTRCRGKVPDCMDAITVASVVEHAMSLLAEARPHPSRST